MNVLKNDLALMTTYSYNLHPGTALRLILKDVISLLHVDTDILFLQPVEEIWSILSLFNSTQLAAMALELEDPPGRGVNSGNDMTSVPLQWEELLMPLLQKHKLNITWGDQDLLNIIFHYNPACMCFCVYHDDEQPTFRAVYEAIQKVMSSSTIPDTCEFRPNGGEVWV
uniref:Uncharacterized protein n=1 Tax=Oncorhynchus tshawytscha TaxID=74940 RepID=A0AAZ3QQH9_ONCTS